MALTLSGCGATVLPNLRTGEERLALARKLASEGQRLAAIDLLRSYVERNAGASEVDAALYLLGECYLGQKEWASAQLEFERLLRDYPESDSAGSASYQLGQALFGQARGPDFDPEFTQKALNQWLEYRAGYPDHWRAAQGDRRIVEMRGRLASKLLTSGQLYLRLRLPVPARTYFEKIITEFADLPLSGQAEIGLAVCERLEGKKEEAVARLLRIEQERAGTPAAAAAHKERVRTEKLKVRAPSKPIGPIVPDVGS